MDRLFATAAIATMCASACKSPATAVRVLVDTDAPAERSVKLSAIVRRSDASADASASGADRFEIAEARERLPGSFTVRPSSEVQTQVLLELRADVGEGATAREPPVQLRRLVRFGFVQGSTQQLRIVFALRCGERSVGCAQVASESCTVQQVCEEMGQTCGERGVCVPIDQQPDPLSDAGVADTGAPAVVLPPTAHTIEGASSSTAYSLSTDALDDSIVLSSSFSGAGTFLGTALSASSSSGLVARIEGDLRVRWVRAFGVGTNSLAARASAVDSDSVWMGAYYHASASWNFDAQTFTAAPVRQRAIACRINDDGTANVCTESGSSGANTQLYRASVVGSTAAFGGVINGTWDLDPTGGAGNGDDGSVVVFRSDRVAWVRRVLDDGGPGATVTGIAVDRDGSVYAAGSFAGTVRVGASGMTGRSAGMLDAFVARFSREGALDWLRAFGSAATNDAINDLALSARGTLYAVGTVGPNAVGITESPAFSAGNGLTDGALLAFDGATGLVTLARRYGTPEADVLDRVAINGDGSLLLGGAFGPSGLAPLPAFSAPVRTGMAILNADASGSLRWAKALYVAGVAQFNGVGPLRRARRTAFAATLTLDAGQGAPSWAPSLPVVAMRSTALLGTFANSDVIEVPR